MNLRLLMTDVCNRSCIGCCNNDFNLNGLDKITSYSGYDKIMITGGEPLLFMDSLIKLIADIREETPNTPIIVYTAKSKRASDFIKILDLVDGITLTLHEQYDVKPFLVIDNIILNNKSLKSKSLRLNVFKGVKLPFEYFYFHPWDLKTNIEWIKDCPLPKNEIFKRVA